MSSIINMLLMLLVFTGIPSLVYSRGVHAPQSEMFLSSIPVTPVIYSRPSPFFHNFTFDGTNYPTPYNLFSCVRRCGIAGHNHEFPCQCHSRCQEFHNCCEDFKPLCLTCRGRCTQPYSKNAPCQCNKKCAQYENCCQDFEEKCPNSKAQFFQHYTKTEQALIKLTNQDNSCSGRCDDYVDPPKPCQCNKYCENFGDCCIDYVEMCTESPESCVNRCSANYDPSKPCQCNNQCEQHGNCCLNYWNICLDQPELPENVTDAVLAAISEDLFSLEGPNNVASLITVRKQGRMSNDGSDNAPEPLLEVNPLAYTKLTLSTMIKLHDNYEAVVTVPENETPEEKQEVKNFLDSILSTPIMSRVSKFLAEKGLVPASDFRQSFEKIWFGLYSRQNGVRGSSGFEHVFLGELKNGVSGFHHWSFFAREEQNNRLNYKGYIRQFNLGSKGIALSEGFVWRNSVKPVSSMFIGTSPEFELGLYTICWYARPNALCPLKLNGGKLKIQTFDMKYKGEKYVASAYPDV